MNDCPPEATDNAVEESLAAKLEPFGFVTTKVGPAWFRAESDRVEIDVILAIITVKVQMRRKRSAMHALELWWVMEAVRPDLPEADRYPRRASSAEAMTAEVERQLGAMVQYCRALLEGEPAAWEHVEHWERDLGGLLQGESETTEHYALRMRALASAALPDERYWRVHAIYRLLQAAGVRLSRPERRALAVARRHTFLIP